MTLREYSLIGLAEAEARHRNGEEGPAVTRAGDAASPGCAPAKLRIPAIRFGHVDPATAGRPIRQDPDPFHCPRELAVGPFPVFEIHDAVVHTHYGIVTAGNHLFRDTLYHVPLHLIAGAQRTETAILLPDLPQGAQIDKAAHLLAGGADNYYHWLIDVLTRIETDRHGYASHQAADADAPLLLPGLRWDPGLEFPPAFQSESLRLLLRPSVPRRMLSSRESLKVDRLRYVPNLSGAGFSPHPDILRVFDALIARVLGADAVQAQTPAPASARRNIYVSRQDTQQRRMSNEAEVIELMKSSGFEIIEPGKLSVAEQIRVFHGASQVVGPHGAGLTNLLFCRPGTVICELHMDGYVQWAMCSGLCAVGDALSGGPAPAALRMPDRVRQRALARVAASQYLDRADRRACTNAQAGAVLRMREHHPPV